MSTTLRYTPPVFDEAWNRKNSEDILTPSRQPRNTLTQEHFPTTMRDYPGGDARGGPVHTLIPINWMRVFLVLARMRKNFAREIRTRVNKPVVFLKQNRRVPAFLPSARIRTFFFFFFFFESLHFPLRSPLAVRRVNFISHFLLSLSRRRCAVLLGDETRNGERIHATFLRVWMAHVRPDDDDDDYDDVVPP